MHDFLHIELPDEYQKEVSNLKNLQIEREDFVKTQQKIRSRRFRGGKRKIEFWVAENYATRLKSLAHRHNLPLASYVRGLIEAQLQKKLYTPNVHSLYALTMEIRKIGNLINQTVRHIHYSKEVSIGDIKYLSDRIQELSKQIEFYTDKGYSFSEYQKRAYENGLQEHVLLFRARCMELFKSAYDY